jgi:hypothetical protein
VNLGALDDIARQVAAAPTSRRATLKAVAAGVLFGLPRRTSRHGLPPARAVLASSSPVCDWKAGAADCLALLAGAVACEEKCKKFVTDWKVCIACAAGLVTQSQKCKQKLNCHCANGSAICSPITGDDAPECCDPPEVCDDNFGCQSPCGPCEQRTWYGACQSTCTGSQTCCNGQCVNTSTDSNNCGSCGNVCTGGTTCQNGQCACPSGQTMCTDQCVDTSTNPDNCGACGVICSTGQPCCGGNCCAYGGECCAGGCLGFGVHCCHSPNGDYVCPDNQTCCVNSIGNYTCCS